MFRLHTISSAFFVHSHCLPIGIFSLHQFMQCEPESIRKRFATVVRVLAAVGVVSRGDRNFVATAVRQRDFTYYRRSLSSLVHSSNVDLLFAEIVGILDCAIVVCPL